MSHLVMAHVTERDGAVEAEPVIVDCAGERLVLELEDGRTLDLSLSEVLGRRGLRTDATTPASGPTEAC